MRDVFYSADENILFYIAGYDRANGGNVQEAIKYLSENVKKLADKYKIDETQVNSFEITQSMRYKYMRVFWVKTELNENITDKNGVFFIGTNEHKWTMMEWIK